MRYAPVEGVQLKHPARLDWIYHLVYSAVSQIQSPQGFRGHAVNALGLWRPEGTPNARNAPQRTTQLNAVAFSQISYRS